MQHKHSPQAAPQQHDANTPGNPFADQAQAQSEKQQQAMAAESERQAASRAHVEQGNAHIKQPDKSRNGS
ncbi:hypothetical protein Herbaro_11930 [Herbaspirillum sp. WKF16]|jgi:hypothetical protein|uniref:hypothetical protein n=1 Tax=Herbaspirillum sp. WKF16 TaxID=3028312 RepID=UPI0023A9CB77|nr:hypothetical protein [Herbaspirillum sp. WKF16]WDZ94208.1 hypothetical protein Herbaro_11930 [Herbaspirillum sp. WKF16]